MCSIDQRIAACDTQGKDGMGNNLNGVLRSHSKLITLNIVKKHIILSKLFLFVSPSSMKVVGHGDKNVQTE